MSSAFAQILPTFFTSADADIYALSAPLAPIPSDAPA
jgi:hypothetical protein